MKSLFMLAGVSAITLVANAVPGGGSDDSTLRWFLMSTGLIGASGFCAYMFKELSGRVRELEKLPVRVEGLVGHVTSIENRQAKSDSANEKLAEAIYGLKEQIVRLNERMKVP